MKLRGREPKSWEDLPIILQPREVVQLLGLETKHTLHKLAEAGMFQRTPKPVLGSYKYYRDSLKEYCQREGCDPFER